MIVSVDRLEPASSDIVSHRVATLENGNKVHIMSKNPWGLWEIHYDKGQLPADIRDGRFTTYDDALRALTTYLGKKNEKEKK